MSDSICLKIWHGGVFALDSSKKVVYSGGCGRTFEVNVDELCGFYLLELANECGEYNDIDCVFYLIHGLSLVDGLVKVFDDYETRKMIELCLKYRSIELYVQHGKRPPLIIDNTCNEPTQTQSPNAKRPAKFKPRRNLTHGQTSVPTPQVTALTKPNNAHVVPSTTTHATTKDSVLSFTSPKLSLFPSSPKHHPSSPKFIVSEVPLDYQWEDNRESSPVLWQDQIYTTRYSDTGSDSNVDFDPGSESDSSQIGSDADDDEECGIVDDQQCVEELQDGCETSDDEWKNARQRVKGWNKYIIDLSNQLEVDAREGKLPSQLIEGGKNGVLPEGDGQEDEGGWLSEYCDSEDEIHTPTGSGEEDNGKRAHKGEVVAADTDFKTFKWKVGQRFLNRDAFKEAVAKYGVFQGRNVGFLISNKGRQQRLGVGCTKPCPFRLYASWDSRRATFVVKSVRGTHTCVRNMERNTQLTSAWMAKQLLEVFKSKPHWPAKEIVDCIRVGYKVMVKKGFAYKVKYRAHKLLHGSMKSHYKRVGAYIEALKATGEGHDIVLVTEQHPKTRKPIFRRLYICFEGVKKGWIAGCRKVIAIDSCFLKTFLGGQLMCAIGRDGNDQMYPIAWAVVEGENIQSWNWFLIQLQNSLALEDGAGVVIISDQHLAIQNAVASVLPSCEYRHCARHIFANWHKSYKGDEMKALFWGVVKAYNMVGFREAFDNLKKVDEDAAAAFMKYNPKVFCRAYHGTTCITDVVTSNMAETFNGYIISARSKHLIYMLEDIRSQLMQRLVQKRNDMEKWTGTICPRIQKRVERIKHVAASCYVFPSTTHSFQVHHELDKVTVNLDKRECTCRFWDMTGIPCIHATACVFFLHKNVEEYVANVYTIVEYKKAYEGSIPPLEGERSAGGRGRSNAGRGRGRGRSTPIGFGVLFGDDGSIRTSSGRGSTLITPTSHEDAINPSQASTSRFPF